MQVATAQLKRRGAGRFGAVVVLVGVLAASACSTTSSSKPVAGRRPRRPARRGRRPRLARPPRRRQRGSPTVTGPITGGTYGVPFNTLASRLAKQYGYSEQEYFIQGDATAYAPDGTFGADGKWPVTPTSTAPYETRIVVRRPTDPAQFNGTVIVEWLNVTSGMDADADFGFAHDELMRDGFAYVGVSAQSVGVEGGGVTIPIPIPGLDIKALKPWDGVRYGALHHPGDQYSYDIFSQAGQAVANSSTVKPLGDLRPQRMIATGESQSASRMVTYANAVQPVSHTYDGFLIHSRGPSGSAVNADPALSMPKVGAIRDDLTTPVMQIETETDLFGLSFFRARQPDTAHLVTWELAGTSHADQYTIDAGVESGHEWNPTATADFTALCGRVNEGIQTYLVRTAFHDLNRWVAGGPPPAPGAPLQVVDNQKLARDPDGNVLGGVRNPQIDVPTQTLTGEADKAKSVICSLFGGTAPYPAEKLAALYPEPPGLRRQGHGRHPARRRHRPHPPRRPARDRGRRPGRQDPVLSLAAPIRSAVSQAPPGGTTDGRSGLPPPMRWPAAGRRRWRRCPGGRRRRSSRGGRRRSPTRSTGRGRLRPDPAIERPRAC